MNRKKPEPPLIRPSPIKGFSASTAFCIPYSPSEIIAHRLDTLSELSKTTPFGTFYKIPSGIAVSGCLGAPLSVISLERLIASGTKRIIFLGFCGSINPQIPVFSTVSVSAAVSQEGTSRHYIPQKKVFHPSQDLQKKLDSLLEKKGLSLRRGTCVSTDAPFRETRSWLLHNLESNIDFVDMEVAAVLALKEFYGIEAASLMIVSDELFEEKWKKGFGRSELDRAIAENFFPLLETESL